MSLCSRWHLCLHDVTASNSTLLGVPLVRMHVCVFAVAHCMQRGANVSLCDRPPTHRALIWSAPVCHLVSAGRWTADEASVGELSARRGDLTCAMLTNRSESGGSSGEACVYVWVCVREREGGCVLVCVCVCVCV